MHIHILSYTQPHTQAASLFSLLTCLLLSIPLFTCPAVLPTRPSVLSKFLLPLTSLLKQHQTFPSPQLFTRNHAPQPLLPPARAPSQHTGMPTQLPLTQPYLSYTATRAPAEMTQHLAQDPTLHLVPRAENQKDIRLTAKSCVICSFGMWGYKRSPMRICAPPFTYANFLLL